MEAGGIRAEKRHRKLLKEELNALRIAYLRERSNLGYYASDKQIADGLTKIRKRAAFLHNALRDSKAIEYALMEEYILSCRETLPNTGDLKSEAFVAKLEDDIAAVGRIHDLAKAALEMQLIRAESNPNLSSKPTAEKPELAHLIEGILQLWTEKLGRKESGADAHNLLSFAAAIFTYILQSPVAEETAGAHLKKARRRRRERDARKK